MGSKWAGGLSSSFSFGVVLSGSHVGGLELVACRMCVDLFDWLCFGFFLVALAHSLDGNVPSMFCSWHLDGWFLGLHHYHVSLTIGSCTKVALEILGAGKRPFFCPLFVRCCMAYETEKICKCCLPFFESLRNLISVLVYDLQLRSFLVICSLLLLQDMTWRLKHKGWRKVSPQWSISCNPPFQKISCNKWLSCKLKQKSERKHMQNYNRTGKLTRKLILVLVLTIRWMRLAISGSHPEIALPIWLEECLISCLMPKSYWWVLGPFSLFFFSFFEKEQHLIYFRFVIYSIFFVLWEYERFSDHVFAVFTFLSPLSSIFFLPPYSLCWRGERRGGQRKIHQSLFIYFFEKLIPIHVSCILIYMLLPLDRKLCEMNLKSFWMRMEMENSVLAQYCFVVVRRFLECKKFRAWLLE